LTHHSKEKLLIGAHTSASGGSFNALIEGSEITATTVQLFTSNQKQWKGRLITEEEMYKFMQVRQETGIDVVMSHAGYLINLGSPDPLLLEKSRASFKEEIERCHTLKIHYLNFHPGAYTSGSEPECIETIIESLLRLAPLIQQGSTELLLETTAGQGSSIGHQFTQLGKLIQGVKATIPTIGVCIDTCHIFAAGYDISTSTGWERTLETFEQEVGLSYLKAFHLNDSKHPLGSHKDRHANLGEGFIGLECFQFLMQDPRTRFLPKYLETPDGLNQWKKELTLLREFAAMI
jgi:deoxyribonuclease IV